VPYKDNKHMSYIAGKPFLKYQFPKSAYENYRVFQKFLIFMS